MNATDFRLVDGCVDELHRLALTKSVNIEDNNIELVVQVAQTAVDGAHASCQYYFVDHGNRTLFWLHDHSQVSDIFCGLRGIYDLSHIGVSCSTYDTTGMN